MENTITLKKLKKAHEAFGCNQWKESINEILDSVSSLPTNASIVIPGAYIEKLKKYGTTNQLIYCISLGFKLLEEESYKDLSNLFNTCEIELIDGKPIWCDDKGVWMFYLDTDDGYFWYSYHNVHLFFKNKYDYRTEKIVSLIQTGLLELLNIQGMIPYHK